MTLLIDICQEAGITRPLLKNIVNYHSIDVKIEDPYWCGWLEQVSPARQQQQLQPGPGEQHQQLQQPRHPKRA